MHGPAGWHKLCESLPVKHWVPVQYLLEPITEQPEVPAAALAVLRCMGYLEGLFPL